MPQWEYLTITANMGGQPHEWRPTFVNDAELAGWEQGPTLLTYMNRLGAEGWELVSDNHISLAKTLWEYTWLVADYQWTGTEVGGHEVRELQGYMQYIGEQGGEGWELAAALPNTAGTHWSHWWWLLIFKRPIRGHVPRRLLFKRLKG